MKNLSLKNAAYLLAAFLITFASCKKYDGGSTTTTTPDPTYPENAVLISANISTDQTWSADSVYYLTTRVAVESGATLTIEPGTVIKGEDGYAANATALIIARGATIMAKGTATKPIIFTSASDKIVSGQLNSPNIDPEVNSLWGGVIILGNAKISADADTRSIEGIPDTDQNGKYGGQDDADNSGVFSYVSIRHGGASIGQGNEINALTLGGVGSSTQIDHIEIVSNQDDGIEFFGGTVNVSHVVVYAAGDDALDVDQAWAGTLQNFIVICNGTDHALEIDGPEGPNNIRGGNFTNGSIKGDKDMGDNAEMANFRDAAMGNYSNMYFFNFIDPSTSADNSDLRGDFSLDDETKVTFANSKLIFSDLEATLENGVALDKVFKNGIDVYATLVELKSNTVGADKSVFQSWTLVEALGLLEDF